MNHDLRIFRGVVVVLLCALFRAHGQSFQIVNVSGVPFSAAGSVLVFPVGQNVISLSPVFVSAWNSDLLSASLGPLDLTNDFSLLISTAGASLNRYDIGELSPSVNASLSSTNVASGIMAALSDPSALGAWNDGLWLGAAVVATLFGFSFIRAIPGGNREDM